MKDDLVEPDPFDDWDAPGCGQCDGEGYVHGCSWDWQCSTYDFAANECLCSRRCEFCNPVTSTSEAIDDRRPSDATS